MAWMTPHNGPPWVVANVSIWLDRPSFAVLRSPPGEVGPDRPGQVGRGAAPRALPTALVTGGTALIKLRIAAGAWLPLVSAGSTQPSFPRIFVSAVDAG